MFELSTENGSCTTDTRLPGIVTGPPSAAEDESLFGHDQKVVDEINYSPQPFKRTDVKILLTIPKAILDTGNADPGEGLRFGNGDGVPEGAYMHHQSHVGEPVSDPPKRLRDNSMVDGGRDLECVRIEETLCLPSLSADAASVGDTSMTSLFYSPIDTIHRSHEETPPSSPDPVTAEGVNGGAPGVPGNSAGDTLYDYQPSSPITPSSPLLFAGGPNTSNPIPIRQSSSPVLVPSSPLTSSPPPVSSSPPSLILSATPESARPQLFLVKLPCKSGAGNVPKGSESDSDGVPLPRSTDEPTGVVCGPNVDQEERIIHHALPNPKHPTAAAQRKQHEKLSRPFRPPRLVAVKHDQPEKMPPEEVKSATPPYIIAKGGTQNMRKNPQMAEREDRSKHSTARAAIQFKSPLISRDTREFSSFIRLTPTIQMLERKLQVLKRAIKVKEDNQGESLRDLIAKWTEAGREVAWEVWANVKDNVQNGLDNDCSPIGGKRSVRESWGWEMGNDKRCKGEENLNPHSGNADNGTEGTDTRERVDLMKVLEEDEDPDRPHDTLGTMLRQLGIDPQTLGWDDEEEAFKEVTGEV